VPLDLGAKLEWKASASNRWVLPWIALLGAATVYLLVQGAVIAALVQVPALFVLELLSTIRVQADPNEVVIRYGHFGLVRQRVKMSNVSGASATELSAWSPYGWGYRGSLRLFKSAAVVVRSGPALQLNLDRGRSLLVTIDDAEAGSRFVNQLRRAVPSPH
jgi:hypothetical protein